jgi:hypothetical protein
MPFCRSLISHTGGGAASVADDLGALAATISHQGISTDDLIFITGAAIATKIRTLAGPFFQDVVLSSAAIPDGEIIAVVPQGLATGYQARFRLKHPSKQHCISKARLRCRSQQLERQTPSPRQFTVPSKNT